MSINFFTHYSIYNDIFYLDAVDATVVYIDQLCVHQEKKRQQNQFCCAIFNKNHFVVSGKKIVSDSYRDSTGQDMSFKSNKLL